jgi:hypothetical protein
MISFSEGGKGAPRRRAPEKVFQLRLSIADVVPRIWRRLLVRETMWLSRLHDSIQVAFEWFDYQTHGFALDQLRYGNPVHREGAEAVEDDRDVTLGELELLKKDHFFYDYHFGDGWRVDLRVEKVLPLEKGVRYPKCVAGERNGPPEDCGGAEPYKDMLYSLKHPQTDLAQEWIEWLGGPGKFDPELFDLEKINKGLKGLGK